MSSTTKPFAGRSALGLLPVALAACLGNIGGDGAPAPAGGSASNPSGRPDPAIGAYHTSLGLRRLTKFEYANTVRDLLGVEGAEEQLSEGDAVDFLSNNAHVQSVGLSELEALARAAEDASAAALGNLVLPSGCSLETASSACVSEFLDGFLLHAFRRPPATEEVSRYAGLFEQLSADSDPPEALRSVIESVLLAPHFLYKSELGQDGELTSWEVASRLSYLLWGTMPDDDLLGAASSGELVTSGGLEAQVGRMLDDEKAMVGTVRFASEWLGFGKAQLSKKGADILGDLPPTLQQDLEEETRLFVVDALLGPSHSLKTLLTATHTFANATVADLYGVSGVGSDFERIELPSSQRRGVLTQPLLIAAHSKESGYSAVQMGRFVRERLLCQAVEPPPPGVNTKLDDSAASAGLPFRERFAQHEKDPACAPCHSFLDPPGFAYLPYDPIGRFRPADPAGNVFDTSGVLTQLDGESAAFVDAPGMLDLVVESDAAHACFTRRYVEYAFGRTLSESDIALYHQLTDGLVASEGDFVAFVARLVLSPDFRTPGPQL